MTQSMTQSGRELVHDSASPWRSKVVKQMVRSPVMRMRSPSVRQVARSIDSSSRFMTSS